MEEKLGAMEAGNGHRWRCAAMEEKPAPPTERRLRALHNFFHEDAQGDIQSAHFVLHEEMSASKADCAGS